METEFSYSSLIKHSAPIQIVVFHNIKKYIYVYSTHSASTTSHILNPIIEELSLSSKPKLSACLKMNWKKHFVFISTALWLRSYQEVKEPTVSEWFPMKMQDSPMRSLGMWLWRWTSGCTWLSAWTEWTAARSPWWWTPAGPLLSIRQTTTFDGTSS